MRAYWLAFIVAVCVWAAHIAAATAASIPCPEALYTIVGDPVGGAGVTSSSAEIGVRASFGDACPPTTATKRSALSSRRYRKRGTWPSGVRIERPWRSSAPTSGNRSRR